MADILDQLEEIETTLKEQERKKNLLQGKYDARMESLEDLGLSSIAAAKKKVNTLTQQKDVKLEELEELTDIFKAKYPDLLEET